ncbi:isopentenyl-diphosphate Delta-isomerase [Georgenia satyanarayanai]|uniref:isopentenyl-diphosphate Delta-isomerase n=1 Tax=Georgenia satyanarayanai TaxID=860221 RepID=UPI00203DA6D7|nr:isopentenyl-diphosphate Delta-isomerase [Georgenia satyanarayanai]MCM3662263.1 isopentenyl-diphosphate Delta-isomerase [Georgenia satyanarayanai]
MTTSTEDLVTLLAEDGTAIGSAPRPTVHTAETPLHLAFSCYLTDASGRLLLTRRALSKKTWAGVWTNSFCGHPRPGEDIAEAITRHARHELGLEVTDVRPAVPDFRYRAVDASGIVENEICPVFVARTTQEPEPNPEEVAEHRWVDPREAVQTVQVAPWAVSPWMVAQVERLVAAGHLPESASG